MTEPGLLGLMHDGTPDDPPLYQSVCTYYIGQICDGIIKPGHLLPSAKRAAEKHGVSEATARKGLRLMARLGWAKSYPGYPFVAAKPEPV